MDLLSNLFDPVGLLLVAVIFVPLERVVSLRHAQGPLRPGFALDLTHLFLSGAMIRLGLGAVFAASWWAGRTLLPEAVQGPIAALPWWAEALLATVLGDLGFYAMHRTFHAVPWLWRFHAVHHSIERMDWLAAHRVHPVDQILTKTASFGPVFFLGFSAEAILIAATIYKWQALAIHANVRLEFGWLSWLIATPRFHHWHHANEQAAFDKNFAGQLAAIDWAFGTLHLPWRFPTRYGTDEPMPSGYFAQLAYPFRAAPRTNASSAAATAASNASNVEV